jgi:hypothetical protein
VKTPAVVRRPILLAAGSVNHSALSGPAVIHLWYIPMAPTGNSVIAPEVVMRPILFAPGSVNQSAPSGRGVIPLGPVESGNSVMMRLADVRLAKLACEKERSRQRS